MRPSRLPAPPLRALAAPQRPGFSSPIPEKQRSGTACSARSHGLGLRPTNVRLAARHSPSLSLGAHHQARFKSFDFVVLAGEIFLIVLNVVDAFGVRGVTRSYNQTSLILRHSFSTFFLDIITLNGIPPRNA